MEKHPITFPFDPTELLINALFHGLELTIKMFEDLPWLVKLGIAVLIYVRIFGKKEKPKRSRVWY